MGIPKMLTNTIAQVQETAFEKRRGVGRVEIRSGYAQVHISQLSEPLTEARLQMLQAMADAGISIDFLKLTQSGLTFFVPEATAEQTQQVLTGVAPALSVTTGRCIVLISAVNMRDEEGLLAKALSVAIGCAVPIDSIGDMHDALLIATTQEGADTIAHAVTEQLLGRTHEG